MRCPIREFREKLRTSLSYIVNYVLIISELGFGQRCAISTVRDMKSFSEPLPTECEY